jgi:hypothetical protein
MQPDIIDKFSHLGRIVDPRIPSNLFAAVIAGVALPVAAIARLIEGRDIVESVLVGLGAALAVFLAWAIGREIDPDHPVTANGAAILGLLAVLVWEVPDLLALAGVLLAMRVVNRTTGLKPTIPDVIVLVAISGILAAVNERRIIGFVATIAFLMDAYLPRPNRPQSLIYAGVTLAVTIVATLLTLPVEYVWSLDNLAGVVAAVIVLIFAMEMVISTAELESTTDRTREPLFPSRVLAGQTIAFMAAIGLLLWYGEDAFVALSGVWAAIISIDLRAVRDYVRARLSGHQQEENRA